MKQKVKIRPYAPFNRWVVLKSDDLSLGWSGSQWVPLYGNVQVSNFDTDFDAMMYALKYGFEVDLKNTSDLIYRMARHIRNTDKIDPLKWGVDAIDLLEELRTLNPERYDNEVKADGQT